MAAVKQNPPMSRLNMEADNLEDLTQLWRNHIPHLEQTKVRPYLAVVNPKLMELKIKSAFRLVHI